MMTKQAIHLKKALQAVGLKHGKNADFTVKTWVHRYYNERGVRCREYGRADATFHCWGEENLARLRQALDKIDDPNIHVLWKVGETEFRHPIVYF